MDSTPQTNSQDSSSVLTRALNGDVEAQFQLSCLLEEEGQIKLADGWFKKAALNGHVEAAYRVGMLCLADNAVTRKDAIFWLNKAAAQGHSQAEYQLGCVYECGLGVKMDPDIAMRWYRSAAQHGNHDATEKLDSLNRFLDQIIPDHSHRQERNGGLAYT